MVMILPVGTLMVWTRGETVVQPTDHNRAEISVDFERLGNSSRAANGLMRGYHIADKRSWSTSWDMLPAPTSETVDGMAGGADMEAFYLNTKGEFLLSLRNKDINLDETVMVRFSSFSKSLTARGAYDMWSVSVGLEEC